MAVTYLAELQTVIYCVLEGAQHNLLDEGWVDDRLIKDEWHELAQVGENEVRLVVSGRIECGQGQASDFQVLILEHRREHIYQHIAQHGLERLIRLGQSVSDSQDSHPAHCHGWRRKKSL